MNKGFDYSQTTWGVSGISDFKYNFQGYELELLVNKFKGKKKLRVLDLGCGGGNVAGYLKSKFPSWDITGVDISDKAISAAKKNYPKVKFVKTDVIKLKLQQKSFDLILSLDTLEHFKNYKKVIKNSYDLLKDSGTFFLAVPLEKSGLYKIANSLSLDVAKRKSVGHINLFDDKRVTSDFKNEGFSSESRYFGGHFLYAVLDFGIFALFKSDKSKKPSFESSIALLPDGPKKYFLTLFKSFFSALIYFENKLFANIHGGRGHYFFKKTDFFSVHPPLKVAEKYQIKNGLKKVLRPKDLYIADFLKNYKKVRGILDFGCADGLWLERILHSIKAGGAGIDASPLLINLANSRIGKRGSYYLSAGKLKMPNTKFDLVVSFDVFEHIKDKEKEVKLISRSLKKGGGFFFYTLNPNNKFTFDWMFESLGSDFLYKHADHDKTVFISPTDFSGLLSKNGFSEISYELFDGPFNLFWEVATYALFGIFKNSPDWVLNLNDKFIRAVYPVNRFLDSFFTKKGYSNGYFIWGIKK